jgi:hypothetical protein
MELGHHPRGSEEPTGSECFLTASRAPAFGRDAVTTFAESSTPVRTTPRARSSRKSWRPKGVAGAAPRRWRGRPCAPSAVIAEAGCTTDEIKSITGHVTGSMVDKYAKSANQKRQASAAISKLERNTESTWIGKHNCQRMGNSWASSQKDQRNHGAPYGSRTRLFRLKI